MSEQQIVMTGKIISDARKKHGYTQETLAEELGVTRQAVSRWESGTAYPETDKLVRISVLLDIDLNYMLKGNPDEHYADPVGSEAETASDKSVLPGLLNALHYEYKSERKLFGIPLIHINIGVGAYRAKGIIAIGMAATGIISIGLASIGIISVGLAALGLLALGFFSGGIFAGGAAALGLIAMGAVAIGLMSFGAVSIGMFAFGALSVGGYVAVGAHAYGGIVIAMVHGHGSIATFLSESDNLLLYDRDTVMAVIDEYVPKFWIWFISICKTLL